MIAIQRRIRRMRAVITRLRPGLAARLVAAQLGVVAAAAVAAIWATHPGSARGVAFATVALAAVLALGMGSVSLAWFVHRRVTTPVRQLNAALRRIAAGDYTRDVEVPPYGELRELALNVNRIRAQVSGYVRHVDASVQRLQSVSRALTATTDGVQRLQEAVVTAAEATAGAGAGAMLLVRRGDELWISEPDGRTRRGALEPAVVARILSGTTARIDRSGRNLLAVPMVYADRVIGALVTLTEKPVFDGDQRALEALASNAAVALENTRMFEQERAAVQRLSELSRLKSEFLGTAQHEMRAPVLAIQTQLELLTLAWQQWDDAARLDALRDIEISTRLLSDLLDGVVELSLLSADSAVLNLSDVDVADAAADALNDVRAHFKGELPVTAVCSVSAGTTVRADAARLRKVLRALLDNAVKFTPEGGHVTLRAAPDADASRCRIEVIDDGIGISDDALPRVFDRFFQEDNGRTRRYGGMGIGLALVRKLCEVHGATVSVESTQGAGARFTLTWPVGRRTSGAGSVAAERWEPLPTLARFPG